MRVLRPIEKHEWHCDIPVPKKGIFLRGFLLLIKISIRVLVGLIMSKRKVAPSSEAPAAKKPKTTHNEEESFPRGGKNPLTPLEVKQIHEEVKRDLFSASSNATDETSSKSPNKKKRRKNIELSINPNKNKNKRKSQTPTESDDPIASIISQLDNAIPSRILSIDFKVYCFSFSSFPKFTFFFI